MEKVIYGFFSYWQTQQALCLWESLEILQDVRIYFKVSTTELSKLKYQSLAKLFKFLVEEPWQEVRRAKGASQYLLCFQKYINRLKINPKKKIILQ